MRYLTTTLLSFIPALVFSQSLISSSGSVDSRFSYSLGEVLISTTADTARIITAGFHQPNLWGVVVVENPGIRARVYPNPTSSRVTLELLNMLPSGKTLLLTGSDGKILYNSPITAEMTELSFDSYPTGTYTLSISESGKIIANYRIIKVK